MKIKYLIASFALASALAGCQEATEYTPSIYMTEAQKEPSKTVTIYNVNESVEFSVSASKNVDAETHVQLSVSPELLDGFNQKYGRTCQLLSEDSYEFAKKDVTIKSGFSTSEAAAIKVTKELLPGTFYCLPVQITSTDGSMPVLEPSKTLFIIFRAPVKSKAMYLGSGNQVYVTTFNTRQDEPGARDLSAVPELTLECRVYANAFQLRDPWISSIMGVEGQCCIRFGDVKIGYDVVQVCYNDYQPAAISAPCATGKWYHIAAVWSRTTLKIFIDGKFITETKHLGEKVNLARRDDMSGRGIGFCLGAASVYQSGRPLDGYVAEARVWTRALGNSEIANIKDLVIVDPASPDLLAYWKMNQCEPGSFSVPSFGRSFRSKIPDLTGNGYDAYGGTSDPSYINTVW